MKYQGIPVFRVRIEEMKTPSRDGEGVLPRKRKQGKQPINE